MTQPAGWRRSPARVAKPYSNGLRERAAASVETGGLSRNEAARRFEVGISTVIHCVRRFRETGSVAPARMCGYKPKVAGASISSGCWFPGSHLAPSSSSAISAATKARSCAGLSEPPAPSSSCCRNTHPISTRSNRYSPSSSTCTARQQRAPPTVSATPSPGCWIASQPQNAPTTSRNRDIS